MKSYSNDTDEPVILKTLSVTDAEGVIHYYEVSPEELDSYNYWRQKFDLTEGKEASWAQVKGEEPMNGPDGYYIGMRDGGSAMLEVKDNQIIKKEFFNSNNAYIWSHIDKYYEEKKQTADQATEQHAENKSPDTDGTMRIEGAEIS